MGPRGKEDALVRFAPFSSVVEEAAAPHADRGIRIITRVEGAPLEDGPEVQPERRPPAGDHPGPAQPGAERRRLRRARRSGSTSTGRDAELRVAIGDDGPGYPADLIGRIGEPFVRRRAGPPGERPGYEGMGLGLFIAKTLLERSGAALSFGNGTPAAEPAPARPAGRSRRRRPARWSRVAWPRRAERRADPWQRRLAAARGRTPPRLQAVKRVA